MADVVRDVVVRITLEQINAALKVPDFAPFKAGQESAAKSTAESSAVISKGMSEVEKSTRAAGLQQRQFNKDLGDAVRQGARDYEAQLKKRIEAEKQAAAVAEAAAAKQTAAQLKVLDVTKQLGEGVFQLARGFAFLATSSDEDFQELLRTIAKLQGGFDLIKGGATTIKGLVEGVAALKVATGAATVGQAVFAGANMVVASTSATATGAVLALYAAMGPVGLVLAGITVAATAAAAVWYLYSKNSDSAAAATERMTERIREATRESQIQLNHEKEIYSVNKQANDYLTALMTNEEKIAAIDKSRIERQKQELELTESLIKKRKELAGLEANPEKKGSPIIGGGYIGSGASWLLREYRDSGRAARQAEQQDAINDAKEEEINKERFLLSQYQDGIEEQNKKLAIQKQFSDEKNRELEREKQIVSTAERGLDAARQKLAIEEEKLQSIDAQFGMLTKQEQLEAQYLAEKVKAGKELNENQLKRLSQLGGDVARDYVQGEFAERGQEASRKFAETLGVDLSAKIKNAEEEVRTAVAELAEARANVAKIQAEIPAALQAVKDSEELIKSLVEIFREQGKLIEDMQRNVDENRGLAQ